LIINIKLYHLIPKYNNKNIAVCAATTAFKLICAKHKQHYYVLTATFYSYYQFEVLFKKTAFFIFISSIRKSF